MKPYPSPQTRSCIIITASKNCLLLSWAAQTTDFLLPDVVCTSVLACLGRCICIHRHAHVRPALDIGCLPHQSLSYLRRESISSSSAAVMKYHKQYNLCNLDKKKIWETYRSKGARIHDAGQGRWWQEEETKSSDLQAWRRSRDGIRLWNFKAPLPVTYPPPDSKATPPKLPPNNVTNWGTKC